MKTYVTYDEDGSLTGAFIQEPPEDHIDSMIEVSADLHADWAHYKANEARDGLERIEPADMVVSVPQQVTAGQAREALYDAGLLELIEPAIESIEDEDQRWRARNAWEYRPTVERNSPFVLLMAQALGLIDEQLDQLFIDAAKL